jgi:hypothetical protein
MQASGCFGADSVGSSSPVIVAERLSDSWGLGEEGEDGIASRGCCEGVRTLIVTRLERGAEAGSPAGCCFFSGVAGAGGSESILMAESLRSSVIGVVSLFGELVDDLGVSTDRLREPLVKEVRRRFRDDKWSSSS